MDAEVTIVEPATVVSEDGVVRENPHAETPLVGRSVERNVLRRENKSAEVEAANRDAKSFGGWGDNGEPASPLPTLNRKQRNIWIGKVIRRWCTAKRVPLLEGTAKLVANGGYRFLQELWEQGTAMTMEVAMDALDVFLMGRRLIEKAMFWNVSGRQLWEDGGLFRGYQFPDRIVRWAKRYKDVNRETSVAERLDTMHEASRQKGRTNHRTYFLDNVVTRFAERIGMSRQRVMAKLLDDGIVDWLMRSVDNIQSIPCRETSSLLRGRITEAVNVLEFYYRATEAMGGAQ